MPAYMIFIRETPIHDAQAMADYQRPDPRKSTGHNFKPLVVYGAMEAVEGRAPDGIVIMEFPTAAEARAWYNSPGYQAYAPFRQKAAEYRAVLVEGFTPPPRDS